MTYVSTILTQKSSLSMSFNMFVDLQKMATIPEESKCIIECKDGPVCGYVEATEKGTCYKFKGIPYANPPLGRLRFLVTIASLFLGSRTKLRMFRLR